MVSPLGNTHLLIVGDYYGDSQEGPTIIMFLKSLEAAFYLKNLFSTIASSGERMQLPREPRVRIRGIGSLYLSRRSSGREIELHKIPSTVPVSFDWSATESGWRHQEDLMAPFCEGKIGHQYLTPGNINDDAEIEVSFGEHHWPPLDI